jgi:hypothetical protein
LTSELSDLQKAIDKAEEVVAATKMDERDYTLPLEGSYCHASQGVRTDRLSYRPPANHLASHRDGCGDTLNYLDHHPRAMDLMLMMFKKAFHTFQQEDFDEANVIVEILFDVKSNGDCYPALKSNDFATSSAHGIPSSNYTMVQISWFSDPLIPGRVSLQQHAMTSS